MLSSPYSTVALSLLSFLIPSTNAVLLKDYNPAKAGSKVTDLGGLNYARCPKQFPDCTDAADPGTDKAFYVKNNRYVFYKPAKFDRSEIHGLNGYTFKENQTYYLSWDFDVSGFPPIVDCTGKQDSCTVQSNRIFQYHTFGSPNTLNIPLQLFIAPGSKSVVLYGIERLPTSPETRTMTALWTSSPLKVRQIYRCELRITTSRDPKKGVVEWWWGGVKQNLTSHDPNDQTVKRMPLWDGVSVDPKWGVYGAWETSLTTTIGRVRLGTTHKDVR